MKKPLLSLLGLMLLAGPALAKEPFLGPAPPYLQNGRPGEMTLVWREHPPAAGQVEWWLDDAPGRRERAESPSAYQHEVVLRDLVPGACYRWRARHGERSWEGRFRAVRDARATSVRFAALADMGTGSSAQHAVARAMSEWDPEFVLAAGDVVYPDGSAWDYPAHFFAPYGALLARAPFYPVLGNHDVRERGGEAFFQAFALPAEPGNERFYAFEQGPARFFAIDTTSDFAPGSAQHAWLEREAAARGAGGPSWKIAFMHHPAHSSGLHGPDARVRRVLAPLLARLGFDLAIAAHDHHYERFVPDGGVTWLVTGGGGGWLYRAGGGPRTAAVANAHHFVGLTIAGDTLALRAIDTRGRVLDAHALRRRGT